MEPKELRKKILDLSQEMNGVHIAPAMSCVEIMIALYYHVMNDDDKFILSKGHACLTLYSILRDKGFNPDVSCGHPDIDIENGIECTTGSLGHGLPVAVGMALAKKMKKESGRIFVLLGDSELQEGTTWESLLIASQHRLDNLIIFIDNNELQALDYIDDVLDIISITNKIIAFNCVAIDIIDGNNIDAVIESVSVSDMYHEPKVIVAHTIKGKGVSFMENRPEWHARMMTDKQFEQAYKEIKESEQ